MEDWIKCSDRLPEKHDTYLVVSAGIVHVLNLEGRFWFDLYDELFDSRLITNWMPLPAPPE